MALPTVTINEIAENIIGDIETKINQNIPLLAKAVFRILAYALAGVWIILYKYAGDSFRQRFPQTASGVFLEYLGELKDTIRTPSELWEGSAEILATGDTGTIDADTQFLSDAGNIYTVVSPVAIAPGTLTLSLVASESGEDSSLSIGDTLDIVSPIAGVALTAEISAVSVYGVDQESIADYRQRVIEAWAARGEGGSTYDYKKWGLEAPNVVSIYPYATKNPTVNDIYVEVDDQVDGIPTSTQLDTVEDFLTYDPVSGQQNRKPLGDTLVMKPIYRSTVNVEIDGLDPDTPETRQEITDSLTALMLTKEPYILGISLTRVDNITFSEIVAYVNDVLQAQGATVSDIDADIDGTPVVVYTLVSGEKLKIGDVDFV